MKSVRLIAAILISFILIAPTRGSTQFSLTAIDAVKPTAADVPQGFIFGTVPAPYRKTLKDNPWMMDRAAIKRLADKIYPGGDHNQIMGVHVSIIAKKEKPLGDDIVCYVILYRDIKAAEKEIHKVNEYAGYNRERAIVLSRDNLAVFIFADDPVYFQLVQEMARTIEDRLKAL